MLEGVGITDTLPIYFIVLAGMLTIILRWVWNRVQTDAETDVKLAIKHERVLYKARLLKKDNDKLQAELEALNKELNKSAMIIKIYSKRYKDLLERCGEDDAQVRP